MEPNSPSASDSGDNTTPATTIVSDSGDATTRATALTERNLTVALGVTPRQIAAVARLLAEGNTIPFIARYRKEQHGDLDEVKIAAIQERLTYFQELEERKETILRSISEQGKLSDELAAKIVACDTKTTLEDLYLPYKPKRRTRAMIARERGLQPLADLLLAQVMETDPETAATSYISEETGVDSTTMALAGARDIAAETIAENAEIRGFIRTAFAERGEITSAAVEPLPDQPTKFEQYYDFREPIAKIPSHRFLAIRRGQTEGVLRVRLEVEAEPLIEHITELAAVNPDSPFAEHLKLAVDDAYKRLIAPSVEVDVLVEAKLKADADAIAIFGENLRNLLLQAPLGQRAVLGIDPGLRTGCKCAVLDATGKFLDTLTIFPSQGDRAAVAAQVDVCRLVAKHNPAAIAVGNGTAGRETEAFVRQTLQKAGHKDVIVISVNEAGASVYSASEVARDEFPDLDLTVRGAISIGRRLQDPLAELVKIDPKAIGVGQYQHDVHQPLLAGKLDEVVVSCVNRVGVEVNTASAPLLARVSGIGPTLAKRLVAYRDANGAFGSRKALAKVPGLGPKTFEQAAGFLRIHGAANPLDASAVHPERYALVEQMAADAGVSVGALIGNTTLIDTIPLKQYVSESVGELTLRDIVDELKKPGRDPRAIFEAPKFLDDVTDIEHVRPGMTLEGVVTNVTAFGAFVDIGVHQDGLVHVSQLSDRFIRDPAEVVKAGDKLKVRVLEVDLARKRISLTARSQQSGDTGNTQPSAPAAKTGNNRPDSRSANSNRRYGQSQPRSWSRGNNDPKSSDGGFLNNPFAGL